MSLKMSVIKVLAVPALLISSAAFADVPLEVSSNTITNGTVRLSWDTHGTYYPQVTLSAYSSAEHKGEVLDQGNSDTVYPVYIDNRDVKTQVNYTLTTCAYEPNMDYYRPGGSSGSPIIYVCRSSTQVVKFE